MNETMLTDGVPSADRLDQFSSLLEQYRPKAGLFDEAIDSQGRIRAAWKPLCQELGALSVWELQRRIAQSQRQMDLDGVAFNPHDSTRGVSRPWRLDPVPLALSAAEWEQVARGMDQRARLSDLILLDLLGPQTLLHEKVLPPDALFAHPRYLPACHSLVPRPNKHLHLYAADLARSADGNWWVTAERTRSPFGLGYILENRLVTSRMLPEAFTQCNTRRLASFFMTLQQTLKELANRFKDNPRIAIWTKGPGSRTYFEDSFLARYLGYTLVQGEDLAVREDRVMLKTLGGLLPVEVLLRRIEDHECDPAELMGEDKNGIAGLLEVIRHGNVTVSNSIGSALAESPILLAFLPGICQHLFDEDLLLPSVATWWCGQRKALKYVLNHLDELLIRRAFRSHDDPPLNPASMSGEERQHLVDLIRAKPMQYVGQEKVARSTAPVFETGSLQSWSVALRAFAVAEQDSYQTLQGALARVAPDADVLSHNMTSGEKSQDVWIVSQRAEPTVTLLTTADSHTELKRGGAELPSRVADNLFWLGRNIERAEQLARLVRIALQELTGEDAATVGMEGLRRACRRAKQLGKSDSTDDYSVARETTRGALDRRAPQSLRGVVLVAHATAIKVRDRIALDSFRVITELRDMFGSPLLDESLAPTDFIPMLDQAITALNAISGFASESMTRTQGWRFFDLGRRLERAFQTAHLIRSLLPLPSETKEMPQALELCLQTCDSFMTYRNRYLASIQPAAALDLIITDETNPRSILFQLQQLAGHIDQLPRSESQAGISPEQRIALSLLNAVRLADVIEMSSKGAEGDWQAVHKLLGRLIEQLPALSDAISGRFLIHAGLQRHFGQV